MSAPVHELTAQQPIVDEGGVPSLAMLQFSGLLIAAILEMQERLDALEAE